MKRVRFVIMPEPVAYSIMLERQLALRDALMHGKDCDTVFLLEHTPTITLGRRARPEHILKDADELARMGVAVVPSDRGGDVTYHGPGQLVVYPVLNLTAWRPSVDWYLRTLEETLILLLQEYGLHAERQTGFTGVWVNGAKIAAIGVSVRHWISCHGAALNISPNEDHWNTIIPCGLQDKPITSLARLMEDVPDVKDIMKRFIRIFSVLFECEEAHEN